MAQNIQDLVSDVDLTVFSRQVPEPIENSLASVLPNREINGRKSKAARHARKSFTAKFRSYNAEAPIGQRGDSITVTEFSLPPVSEKLPVNEELIHQLNESPSATAVDRLVEATYDDVENLTTSVRNRVEKARGEFLTTGKISIDENGVVDEADFGLAASHKVTPLLLWSDPAADIIEDELKYVQIILDDADPHSSITATVSKRLVRLLARNEAYRRFYWQPRGSDIGPTLSAAQVNDVRESNGLPSLNVYDGFVPDNANGKVRVIPDTKYILTTDTVGETQWGTTAESLALVGKNSVDFSAKQAPGLSVNQWSVPDPVVTWTKVAAVSLPIPGDINGLLVASVIAA